MYVKPICNLALSGNHLTHNYKQQAAFRTTTGIYLKFSHFSSPFRSANLKSLHVWYIVNNSDKKFIAGAAIANRHLRVSVVRTPSSSYSLRMAAETIVAMPRAHNEKLRRLLLHNFEMDLGDWASGSSPCSMGIEVEEASLSWVLPCSVSVDGSDGVGASFSASLLREFGLEPASSRVSDRSFYRIYIPSSETCPAT